MGSGRRQESIVDVIVVNWNGRRFLPRCLAALERSTIPIRVTVVDNASSDDSASYVRSSHDRLRILEMDRNLGYAGGANAGLAATTAPFAFIMNPDVVLAPDHLEHLVRVADDLRVGGAQGKLYSLSVQEYLMGRLSTDTLDSVGHVVRRTRMVFDRGQGEADGPCWNRQASVFSATGAALLLRRSMIEDIALDGSPFDDAFFSYKEDIDLCWRSRLLGWDIRYVPEAEGWHARALPGIGRRGRGASARARRHSWMNHWLMMLKNDRPADVLRHLPWIGAWEFARVGYALFRDPALLPAYLRVWGLIPEAWRARKQIQRRRRASPGEMRRWFTTDSVPPAPSQNARTK
jgi:GT2 family glycosyltransferase